MRWRGRRRTCAAVPLLTAVLAGAMAAACSAPAPTATDLRMPADSRLLAFGPTRQGATLLTTTQLVTVAKPGASAETRASAEGEAVGGSLDLDGKTWWALRDGSIVSSEGTRHGATPAVQSLYGPVTGGSGTLRKFDPWTVSVASDSLALVATYADHGSTFWHVEQSVVHAVSASGDTVLAGRADPIGAPPVSGLHGTSAPATSVALERVQAIVPLSSTTVLLLMNAPTEEDEATRSRLQAAVVKDGQISSVALPPLCAGQFEVRGARISDREAVISAPAVEKDGTCNNAVRSWVDLDTSAGSATSVGTGGGLAYLDGGTLVTATRVKPDSDTVHIAWQQPTSG